jgi:hypothetical protein
VRLAEFSGNGYLAGLAESQVPRADTTAKRSKAAHVLRLLVEQMALTKSWFGLSA